MSASEPGGRIAVSAEWLMAVRRSTRQWEICALAHVSGGFAGRRAVKWRPLRGSGKWEELPKN